MGKAIIRFSEELLKLAFDFPPGWRIAEAHIMRRDVFGLVSKLGEDAELILTVEGDSITERLEGLLPELRGMFQCKFLEGDDGKWIQGHWELW